MKYHYGDYFIKHCQDPMRTCREKWSDSPFPPGDSSRHDPMIWRSPIPLSSGHVNSASQKRAPKLAESPGFWDVFGCFNAWISWSRWWQLKYFWNFHPYLGKIPILTYIFQMGWNHQPDDGWARIGPLGLFLFIFFSQKRILSNSRMIKNWLSISETSTSRSDRGNPMGPTHSKFIF